jgi:hypothetical protein
MRPEEHDPKQKAKKKNDHFLDCLRYILNSNPRYMPKVESEGELEYTGEYVKYPTNKVRGGSKSSYFDLVEK